ncbi:DUF3841 domain-containing protein [Spartinivicinus poritis]|uniref:DUF3841 domain-containing protein n=1 Tax=Spartinivicinus poritis TaxID=2994640 RepID=A0ABT5UBC9_9GAMM|nr:DUF3841 domain-containing protein [Spartinivicinus sp. A2-2]MDE1463675.1 DUF3841 domain-containing protein [Spartinivicinus sp. A2-2]
MKLWTFQHTKVAEHLEYNNIYYGDPKHVDTNWLIAYQWMSERMQERNINIQNSTPIWLWAYQPTFSTLYDLLSEHECSQGVCLIEVDVPGEQAVFSCYDQWNTFLYYCLEHKRIPIIDNKYRKMFTSFHDLTHRGIQVTLPYLKQEWVCQVKDLTSYIRSDEWCENNNLISFEANI